MRRAAAVIITTCALAAACSSSSTHPPAPNTTTSSSSTVVNTTPTTTSEQYIASLRAWCRAVGVVFRADSRAAGIMTNTEIGAVLRLADTGPAEIRPFGQRLRAFPQGGRSAAAFLLLHQFEDFCNAHRAN